MTTAVDTRQWGGIKEGFCGRYWEGRFAEAVRNAAAKEAAAADSGRWLRVSEEERERLEGRRARAVRDAATNEADAGTAGNPSPRPAAPGNCARYRYYPPLSETSASLHASYQRSSGRFLTSAPASATTRRDRHHHGTRTPANGIGTAATPASGDRGCVEDSRETPEAADREGRLAEAVRDAAANEAEAADSEGRLAVADAADLKVRLAEAIHNLGMKEAEAADLEGQLAAAVRNVATREAEASHSVRRLKASEEARGKLEGSFAEAAREAAAREVAAA